MTERMRVCYLIHFISKFLEMACTHLSQHGKHNHSSLLCLQQCSQEDNTFCYVLRVSVSVVWELSLHVIPVVHFLAW